MQMDLSERDYVNFSNLIHEKCGIYLHKGKKELLKARLAKLLRGYDFDSIRDYYKFLMTDESGQEMISLLDSISTNLTYFFREPRHFEFLSQMVVPQFLKSRRGAQRQKIHVWCAGCSSGEEPYSIAITLLEALPQGSQVDVSILATDISTRMLAVAAKGIYGSEKMEKIPYEWKRRYFQKGFKSCEGYFRVKSSVKDLVTFRRVNLVEPFPWDSTFDAIFCRNVMIYFDKPTQERLVNRFHQALSKDGYLLIGLSESLTGIQHPFKYIQPSIYLKN
ncbi:MAG: protein-glutamate O-methyltransferase CheR [Thermodesulfobacteriota bacterium]